MPHTLIHRTRHAYRLTLLLPVVVAVTVGFAYWKYDQSFKWVLHTKTVITEIDNVLNFTSRAQLFARTYVLREDPPDSPESRSLFKDYQDRAKETKEALRRLRALTRDNPAQRKNIQELERSVNSQFEYFQWTIEHRAEQRSLSAMEDGSRRIAFMDRTWNASQTMTEEEDRLLGIREHSLENMRLTLVIVFLLAMVLSIGLSLWSHSIIIHHEIARAAARRQLEKLNATLEHQVSARTAALRHSNEQLLRSNFDLNQFAHIASHDLQEPLRTVSTYTSLLGRTIPDLSDDTREYMKFVINGIRRMHDLIRDVRNYTQMGNQGLVVKATDMNVLLRHVTESLDTLIAETGTIITVPDKLPVVEVDDTKVYQLLSNLVQNAIKFRKAGENPRIEITARTNEIGDWVFAVKDNGIGFDQQFAEQIFLIFQRLHNQDVYPGTGLGLAICKRIVELHEGRIWAVSEEGKGATFCFSLPKLYLSLIA
jgi:signal transduction histidine kinase